MKRMSFLTILAALFLVAPLASARVLDGGSNPYEATGPDGATVNYDIPDGSTACTPPPGSTFALGDTTVTCDGTDGAGNPVTFTITVVDTTPPAPPTGAGAQELEANTSGGAVATFSLSSTDVVDPNPSVSCDHASGSTFPVGTTTVSCTASDFSGNTSAPTTFTITVKDTTAPAIHVPGDINAEATSTSGAAVSFSVTATDTADASPDVSCDHSSGSTFPIATTTVTCNAKDDAGNTSSGSFHVTVRDTEEPDLVLPGNQTFTATSYAGAVDNYSVSAHDNVDGSLTPSCNPGPGTFPIGTTTVNCSATDHAGNKATGSFTVTVNIVDSAPVLTHLPDLQREANGPQGSIVTYVAPTAVDDIDGPIANVSCSPRSGSVFPLGTTTVTCSATDSHNHTGTTTFQVHVVDTTPPVLTVPGNRTVHATSAAGIASAFFTSLASAKDIVDPHPRVSSNAPDIAPVGKTVVTFIATDASGNSTSGTSTLTVLPVGDTTPLPAAPDVKPPDDVRNLKAKAGDSRVALSWDKPSAKDVKSFIVSRALNETTGTRALGASSPSIVVYQGTATTYLDRKLRNGVDYRYVVVAVDSAGNKSAGAVITAMPQRNPLRRPTDGGQVRRKTRVVKLDWDNAPNAAYYNVQLFLGDVKVLSAWPKTSAYTLHRSWRYLSRRYRLQPGLYHWYVWPGLGNRNAANYGPMLGSSSFLVKP